MTFEFANKPAVMIVIASSCGFVVNALRDLPLSVKDDRRKESTSKFRAALSSVMVDLLVPQLYTW